MHLPNHFVSDPVNVTTGIFALSALAYGARRVSFEKSNLMLMGAMAVFIFAMQMLNFPINGGTSGHFLGAVAAAALLGPWAALIIMASVLTVQSVFFADGGLMALGSNILNMGIVGGVLMVPLMRALRSKLPESRSGYALSVALTSWISIVAASLACSLELAFSGTSPLGVVLPAMLGSHAVIGLGEAMIATVIVITVEEMRANRVPAWKLAGASMALALALVVFAAPFASTLPDGLERVAIDNGFEAG